MLDSRPRGWEFEPHQGHCFVSFSKNINPSLVLVQPRKTLPFITERLLMGHTESNQSINHLAFGIQPIPQTLGAETGPIQNYLINYFILKAISCKSCNIGSQICILFTCNIPSCKSDRITVDPDQMALSVFSGSKVQNRIYPGSVM